MAKIGQWNYAPQYIDQLPSYWHLNHSKKGQILSYKEAERSKAAITNAVLQTWDQNSIGQGQDAEGLTSCGIKILSVKRLENSVLYSNYLQERESLIAACKERGEWCPGIQKLPGSAEPVLSTDVLPDFMKRELCSKVNEVYVFHGTKAENIKSILVNGLNLGYSNPNRLFGQAIYTTESSTKADQYTDPKDARSHPGSDLYMILSRVLLGRVFVCDSRDKIPYLQGPPCTSCNVHNCTCVSPSYYDSIMADGDWMFREFAVHRENRCYPEYIIKYRRERKPAFNLARKELTMSERTAVINNAFMSEDMQKDAVDCATKALKKYNTEEDIAVFIKKEFDKKYNGQWQCFVGGHFGSSISHDTDHYIFFSFGQLNILLFKCK